MINSVNLMSNQAIAQKQKAPISQKQNVVAFKGSEDSFEKSGNKTKNKKIPMSIKVAAFSTIIGLVTGGAFGLNYGKEQVADTAAQVVADINAKDYTELRIKDTNDDGSPEVILKSDDGKQTVMYDIKNAEKSIIQDGEVFKRDIEKPIESE